MCYKYMWDDAVADNFPAEQFFSFFKLNPHLVLSDEIRESAVNSGFSAEVIKPSSSTLCSILELAGYGIPLSIH